MDKRRIIVKLIELTRQNLQSAYDSAQSTYDIATNEESKPENKYDTRGLEASYLAGAQAERVADIKSTLTVYENISIKNFDNDSKIALTALVELTAQNKTSLVLLMPKGGGQVISFENCQIQVITPESPLGKNLIGKEVGEVIQISSDRKSLEYEILKIS